MLNEKSAQKSAQKSTQKALNGKSTQRNAQRSTQKSYISQGSAQNSVFTQKSVSKKYGSQVKQNFGEVHKHTLKKVLKKSPPKSVQGKKFSKKC